jgi:microcystin-dependent protein
MGFIGRQPTASPLTSADITDGIITAAKLAPGAVEGVTTGLIIPWSSSTVPSGFLECDGSSVSTTTYANLFAVVGYVYGGSGASFNLPDLRDRTAVHKSTNKSFATTGGANTVTPTGNISGSTGSTTLQTNTIPSHSHTITAGSACGMCMGSAGINRANTNTSYNSIMSTSSVGGGQSHDHNLSANFVGSANSVLQPYLTLMYIIKT